MALDLKLDKLIGDLHEGIANVIRGHFSDTLTALETDTSGVAATLVAEATADLEKVLQRLESALTPPPPVAAEPSAPAALAGEPHAEVVGQPATSSRAR